MSRSEEPGSPSFIGGDELEQAVFFRRSPPARQHISSWDDFTDKEQTHLAVTRALGTSVDRELDCDGVTKNPGRCESTQLELALTILSVGSRSIQVIGQMIMYIKCMEVPFACWTRV